MTIVARRVSQEQDGIFIANGQLVEWHSFSDAHHGFRHPDNEGYQPHYADLVWPLVTSFLGRVV